MKRILIVEDDRALGDGLCLALKGPEAELSLCRTLSAARSALGAGSFDLLVLDVNLPAGNGLDFRDAHLSNNVNDLDEKEWDESYGMVYKTLFENGLEAPDGLDQDAIDSGTMAYNDNYSAPDEPEEDELDIEDFDPNEIVIDPSEFTDMEDTTVETDDRHMAFAPITAEDLILDPESLDIEVIDNDVLFADEPVIDVDDFLLADTEATDLCGLDDESTYGFADNDADNAFGNDIIDDLMA